MPLTLYHFPQSRSLRPAWLLEELGIDYNLITMSRDKAVEFAKTDEYRAINPLGKFPAMTDGDMSMTESVAIMQYILSRHSNGRLQPDISSPEYAKFLQWLHFGESGMSPYVTMLLVQTLMLSEEQRSEYIMSWAKEETAKCLDFIALGLKDQDYLCSSGFTAADISVFYMLFLLKLIRQFGDVPEEVKTYFDRVKTRPAWQKVSAITGNE